MANPLIEDCCLVFIRVDTIVLSNIHEDGFYFSGFVDKYSLVGRQQISLVLLKRYYDYCFLFLLLFSVVKFSLDIFLVFFIDLDQLKCN